MIPQLIALLFLLLIISAYFSSLETAFTSLTPGQINAFTEKNGKAGKLVKRLMERPGTLLTTLLIGNNLANLTCSAVTTFLTIRIAGNNYVAIATGLLTLTILVFCEVSPKLIAFADNERLCLQNAKLVHVLSILLHPIILAINTTSRLLTRAITTNHTRPLTMENLLHHIKAAGSVGLVEEYEEQLVKNIFRIDETPIAAIMTHRTDLISLTDDLTVAEATDILIKSEHSRAPVFKTSEEQIMGEISLFSLIQAHKHSPQTPISQFVKSPYLVPGTLKISELFFRIKKEPIHLAIVLDEYGGIDGIVTRTDILENICGNLYHEHQPQTSQAIEDTHDGSWIIQGDTNFNNIWDTLGLNLTHPTHTHTVGGYLIEKLEHIPAPGTVIKLTEGEYTILDIHKQRIQSVRFIPNPGADS